MTAAYLHITNPGDNAIEVTGVSASQGEASLHETRLENGRSMMREVSELSIDAGASVVLEPGGMHIMLMGLADTPREGDVINICLQAAADDVCLDAPVRRDAPSDAESMTNHDHH